MTPSPGLERAARVIAENAVSAFMQYRAGPLNLKADTRIAAIRAVFAEVLRVMPTDSSDVLAGACNRGLEFLTRVGVDGPSVKAVRLADGRVSVLPV